MKVTNKLKELDMIDRVPEELWTEVSDSIQEAVIKIIPFSPNPSQPQRLFQRVHSSNEMAKVLELQL